MFDTHLSVGHARAGVGHPVRAAHGSPDHGAGSVSPSSLGLSGAHGLEALVVARNLLPKRVALLGRVVLAALAPVDKPTETLYTLLHPADGIGVQKDTFELNSP